MRSGNNGASHYSDWFRNSVAHRFGPEQPSLSCISDYTADMQVPLDYDFAEPGFAWKNKEQSVLTITGLSFVHVASSPDDIALSQARNDAIAIFKELEI